MDSDIRAPSKNDKILEGLGDGTSTVESSINTSSLCTWNTLFSLSFAKVTSFYTFCEWIDLFTLLVFPVYLFFTLAAFSEAYKQLSYKNKPLGRVGKTLL